MVRQAMTMHKTTYASLATHYKYNTRALAMLRRLRNAGVGALVMPDHRLVTIHKDSGKTVWKASSVKRWHCIGRGKVGWHAEGVDISSSGGDLLDYEHMSGMVEGYLAQAAAGCLVYDAKDADDAAFVRHVVSGPMVSFNIGPYEVRKFSSTDKQTLASMLPGLGGSFVDIAVRALKEGALTFGSLDYVGVGIYEALLRNVPGMKLGHVLYTGATPEFVWEEPNPKEA